MLYQPREDTNRSLDTDDALLKSEGVAGALVRPRRKPTRPGVSLSRLGGVAARTARQRQRQLAVAATDGQGQRLVGLTIGQDVAGVVPGRHRPLGDRDDDVADLEPRLFGGAAARHDA